MTNLRDVLIRPLITEKTNTGMQDNKYTFIVPLNANKVEIRQAVEAVFKVKVLDVDADPLDGAHKLAERALVVVVDPTERGLAAVEGFDARRGLVQRRHHGRIDRSVGGADRLGGDAQRRRRHTVDAARPIEHGGCAPRPHIGENAAHRLFRRRARAKERLQPVEQRLWDTQLIPRCTAQNRLLC